jgi:hypothetical protein
MANTVLSGTSGALYYKPAGTTGTFIESNVSVANDEITVETFLNFKVGDPVEFSFINAQTGETGSGTLPAGITAGTTYYVISYTAQLQTTEQFHRLISSKFRMPSLLLSAKSGTGALKLLGTRLT